MEAKERIEDALMPQKNNDGRDELNLAEFPLCALARLKPGVKTLRFEDRTWDEARQAWVPRVLTITGSDAFGLPTELDADVLLGLIQITRQHDFADRKVPFTRYQLARVLGWPDDSKSYHRLEASLNRWTGVTLCYDGAWWNKKKKCWMDEKFHILDNVWLCHRDRPAPDTGFDESGPRVSAFVWNETIFRSFQAGNLKSIDFDFYTSLRSAVAKRLYRFLDKRFWHKKLWDFDLRELCFEHVGISRHYDTAQLKRKLLPAIRELEERKFLRPMLPQEQFWKLRAREWRVAFQEAEANKSKQASSAGDEANSLTQELVERGVTQNGAMRAVRNFPADRIQKQIEIFDWLRKNQESKISKSPAGFLISSISDDYDPPKEFNINRAEKPRPLKPSRTLRISKPQACEQARDQEIAAFWNGLHEDERRRFESEALAAANDFKRQLFNGNGPLAAATKESLLDAYAIKAIRQAKVLSK